MDDDFEMLASDVREDSAPRANAELSASVRSYRRMRAKRTLLGYLAVWSVVAALALIAQAVAPAAS
ncbi:hypothetical protein QLQ15_17505 [Lysobacter sp. LF1]|uniref:Uncharacterized protein n=1 Tax=Lysobacter stagni TaxID=3045172 RepID=A0ABT6XKK2_9GAMM|nr:hypothetical protein [Lysobacter sp. LF1]MDI9240702.1 hypothetical protein [Lysobacter sp. LF1]